MTKYIGLTGAIGSGKSTVREMLQEIDGVQCFDTDTIAKALLSEKKHESAVRKILEITAKEKFSYRNDKRKVAEILFADKEKSRDLAHYISPFVFRRVREEREGEAEVVIIESALIHELDQRGKYDLVICAIAPDHVRHERLKQNRQMTDENIWRREQSQLPAQQKALKSDILISSDCSLAELKSRVNLMYAQITRGE